MVDERSTVILGSGPAGYTAALYAARANLRPLLVKGLEAGGQLMLTTDVENYPGFPDGILGPELMDAFEKQAARFETDIVAQSVTRVDLSDTPLRRVGRRPRVAGPDADPGDRRERAVAGRPRRGDAPRARRQRLRHVRRVLLPRPRARRRRRWRHGDGGGDVPHEVREHGHDRAPPRRVPRLEDHAGARALEPEDPGDVGHRRRGDRRRQRGDRRAPAERARPVRRASTRPTACSSRSGTPRTPTW